MMDSSQRGPFLTDIDSRAAVKGSRDPLGQMAIWTRLGRHVVGNLPTVSTSIRDFTVLLLGLWFIERASTNSGPNEIDVYLRWEQLAGYARALQNKAVSFRGIERVRRNLNDGTRVTISAERQHQILGNQKIYGTWGLYTVPARSSALAVGTPLRLSPACRAFVEDVYITEIARAGFREADAVQRLIGQRASAVQTAGKDDKLLQALGQLLRSDRMTAKERSFYDSHLVRGGPTDETSGRQTQLAALLERTIGDTDFALSPQAVALLAAQAKDRGQPESLAYRLDRIRHCESVMAPSQRLFMFALSRDQQTVDELAKEVRDTWGERLKGIDVDRFAELHPELQATAGDNAVANSWLEIAKLLAHGEYVGALRALILHNAFVMKQRGGAAAWIELKNTRLDVRFRDELAELPDRSDLTSLWRFPYFLDSLRSVTAQVRGTA